METTATSPAQKLALAATLIVGIGVGIAVTRHDAAVPSTNEGADDPRTDVAAIRSELAQLRRDSAKLRRLVEEAREAPAPELVPEEELEEEVPASATTAKAEPFEHYFARVGEAFEGERSDPVWNPAPELTSKLTKVMPKGSTLDAVSCRKTLCRVQTSHATADDYRELTQAFGLLKGEPIWTGPAVFADVDSQANDGKLVAVIYLGKESLPDSVQE